MTKVKQSLEKQRKVSPMAHLTGQLANPITVSLEKVVERLNSQAGVRPERAQRFNYNIVVNIYYGKYPDLNNYVELELIKMVAEEKGLFNQAQPHLEALRQLVAA